MSLIFNKKDSLFSLVIFNTLFAVFLCRTEKANGFRRAVAWTRRKVEPQAQIGVKFRSNVIAPDLKSKGNGEIVVEGLAVYWYKNCVFYIPSNGGGTCYFNNH